MPLTCTKYIAECDCRDASGIKCSHQAEGTRQRLDGAGWKVKAIYNGKVELIGVDKTALGSLVCPTCAANKRHLN